MRWLKSIFITSFVTYLVLAALHAGEHLVRGRGEWIWVGAALAVFPSVGFFARIFLVPTARTSQNLPWLTASVVAGLVIVSVAAARGGPYVLEPFIQTVLVAAGWPIYLFWYSRFSERDHSRLQVGAALPDFEVEDPEGVALSSRSFQGQPTVWLFYRGNWCPLCTAQIRELVEQYQELDALGAKVALVSPQPHGHTRRLAKKMGVPFHFLVDRGNRAARKLGIEAPAGTPFGFQALGYSSDTVLPTVIITDADGKILFADLTDNYRVRPEPATFLKVLREADGSKP